MLTHRLPSYFISHGGGPWPYMDGMRHTFRHLEASLTDIPRQIGGTPNAILVITGHWEAAEFTVSSGERPGMIYDYSGFPPHTYHVKYPAPGSPTLADRIVALGTQAGIHIAKDAQRGFDHGTFTPLAVMFPDANVPVVQLSLKHGYDPSEHWAIGQALTVLRDEGVLILGSGLSYHNLREFGPGAASASGRFDDWLQRAVVQADPAMRRENLMHWAQAPAARLAHPREDHLVPLMAAAGAAEGEAASVIYHEQGLFGGVTASSFRFG